MTAMAASGVADALAWIARHTAPAHPPVVLVMGSLYLAGEVLRDNGQPPG
jgi:dihydrofolate synthase/folylpolyglutamate synthase